LIADHAAGDARAAISIFRHAAKVAQREGHDRITASVIDGVVSEAKSEIRQKTTEKLTEHQQALYDIITSTGEITPKNLYERYCAAVSDPKTKRMVRNHLSKLREYSLIAANGRIGGAHISP
jgi:Cdc6-related protein, AAA superfamily ATPase